MSIFHELKEKIKKLDKNNKEDKLIYNLMDLSILKYVFSNNFINKDIDKSIDIVIEGYIWLYENNYITKPNIYTILKGEDLDKYKDILENFAIIQEYIEENKKQLENYI